MSRRQTHFIGYRGAGSGYSRVALCVRHQTPRADLDRLKLFKVSTSTSDVTCQHCIVTIYRRQRDGLPLIPGPHHA